MQLSFSLRLVLVLVMGGRDSIILLEGNIYLSNEKNLGWLGYIGDYTTQLYRAL